MVSRDMVSSLPCDWYVSNPTGQRYLVTVRMVRLYLSAPAQAHERMFNTCIHVVDCISHLDTALTTPS